jgi:hypothetical protein
LREAAGHLAKQGNGSAAWRLFEILKTPEAKRLALQHFVTAFGQNGRICDAALAASKYEPGFWRASFQAWIAQVASGDPHPAFPHINL